MISRSSIRIHGWVNQYVLVMVYFVVAAASFNGFYTKWSLRDSMPRFSVERVLDGSAERPFIYRQLLPSIATEIDHRLPDRLRQAFIHKMEGPVVYSGKLLSRLNSKVAANPVYMIRYHALYYTAFLFLFASLFTMRRVCLNAGLDEASGTLAPILFALFFPFLLTGGGYYYDLSELFFLTAAMALAMTRKYSWLVPLTLLATLNKESFLLFLPTLFPLLRARLSRRQAASFLVCLTVLAGAVNLYLRAKYRANPGRPMELHLLENLHSYLNPRMLFELEVNYGVFTLRSYNVFALLLLAIVCVRGWKGLSSAIHRHILIAAAINLPLFFIVCEFGELRDLSLMFGGLLLLVAKATSSWLNYAYPQRFLPAAVDPQEQMVMQGSEREVAFSQV